jgi:hypothetical protein
VRKSLKLTFVRSVDELLDRVLLQEDPKEEYDLCRLVT